jgi:photosystem II stability/assembly factor-like uncharacterized protein
MRSISMLAYCLLAFHSVAMGVSPAPRSAEPAKLAINSLLIDVAAAGKRLVAVGDRGHVLFSDDAGKNWSQAKQVPSQALLTGVCFFDAQHGLAVGHDETILSTSDAGNTWSLTHYAPEKQQPLLDVWCGEGGHALAVGAYSSMYESRDKGASWTARAFEAKPSAGSTGDNTRAGDSDAQGSSHGSAPVSAGDNTRGGDSDAQGSSHGSAPASAGDNTHGGDSDAQGSSHGSAPVSAGDNMRGGDSDAQASSRGSDSHTEVGGAQATSDATNSGAHTSMESYDDGLQSDFHLNRIVGASATRLYIAAEAGHVYRSDDAGASWLELPSAYEGSFFGALPLSESAVLVFGLRGNLYRSNDAGQSWQKIPTRTTAMLNDAVKLDDEHIAVVGLSGVVLYSEDGGRTFATTEQADRKGLSAAWPTGGTTMAVVGESGAKLLDFARTQAQTTRTLARQCDARRTVLALDTRCGVVQAVRPVDAHSPKDFGR